MLWSENLAELYDNSFAEDNGFGEEVTLPGGGVVTGIFYPYPPEPFDAFGSEVGLDMMLARQRAPELHLRDADSAGLKRGDRLAVRSAQWTVAAVPAPDGSGITVLQLKPVAGPGGPPPDQPWQ